MESALKICLRRSILFRPDTLLFSRRFDNSTRILQRWQHVEKAKDKPVKFTTSEAHINYKATENFYDDDRSLPRSHNAVLAGSGIFGVFYLIFLRDDIDADGGVNLIKPVHELVPELAIPTLRAAIAEKRRSGGDTLKLEKKLAEYMKDPDKYGGSKTRLIEN